MNKELIGTILIVCGLFGIITCSLILLNLNDVSAEFNEVNLSNVIVEESISEDGDYLIQDLTVIKSNKLNPLNACYPRDCYFSNEEYLKDCEGKN